MARLLVSAVILFVLAFYGAIVLTMNRSQPLLGAEQRDYYNLLARGFRSGHLWMAVEPDPRLLSARDPYDPAQRPPGSALHDASYFKGHYYIYFGVVPVITLFLPFRFLTHHDIPLCYAVLGFTCLGYMVSAALWLSIAKNYFRSSHVLFQGIGLIILGIGTMAPSLLMRGSIWELAVAAGYFYAMLALYCMHRSIMADASPGWGAFGALSLAAAIGSRPVYVAGGLIILLSFWWAFNRRRQITGRLPWTDALWRRYTLTVAAAFIAPFSLLLWYNHARFGNPFEFGMTYALTGVYEARQHHFSIQYIGFNFKAYFLHAATFIRYFPFVTLTEPSPRPPGYFGVEAVVGILPSLPFACLACAVPLALWGWLGRISTDLRKVLGLCTVFFIAVCLMLLCFLAATARYMVDFLPALMLLASCGMLLLGDVVPAGVARLLYKAAVLGLCVVTVFVNAMASLQIYDLVKATRPDIYNRIAHEVNHIPYWVEQIRSVRYGPLILPVQFARGKEGAVEPLLTAGTGGMGDTVSVQYLADDRIRFRFDHANLGGTWSDPVKITYGNTHSLQIQMGSMFPPVESPFYDGMTTTAVDSIARWLSVSLDNEPVFDAYQNFCDGSANSIKVERDRFSGRIGREEIAGYTVKDRSSKRDRDDFAFTLRFSNMDSGVGFPLLSAGTAGKGNVLFVRLVRPGVLKFGYDQWGAGMVESSEIPLSSPESDHAVTVHMPSLSATSPAAKAKPLLVVKLDGAPAWVQPVSFVPVLSYQFAVGRNAVGSTACAQVFPGTISNLKRIPPEDTLGQQIDFTKNHGVLHLEVQFPTDKPGRSDPLVVAGETGIADFVVVQYLDDKRVRFGLDHWGWKMVWSDPLELHGEGTHNLEIRMPAAIAPQKSPAVTGEMTIAIDGREAWRVSSEFYVPAEGNTALLANPVGGSSCESSFSGRAYKVTIDPLDQ